MNKPFAFFFVFALLVVSFVAGFRFNQNQEGPGTIDTGERRILHYVDPMNPSNIAKEPGIAPCGMPMEPVYADEDSPDSAVPGGIAGPGTIRVQMQKQQIIGVQVDEVTMAEESVKIRALGRIVPDENKVYALVAATDGWMGEIHESTTGSLVGKNQLMGKIRVYDYDFFTWQQRYLTELGNAGRRRVFLSPLSGAADQLRKVVSTQSQEGSLLPDIGAPISLPSKQFQPEPDVDTNEQMTAPSSPPIDTPSSGKSTEPSPGGQHPSAAQTPWGIPPGATQYGTTSEHSPPTGSAPFPGQPGDESMDRQMNMEHSMPAETEEASVEIEDETPTLEAPDAGMTRHQHEMPSPAADKDMINAHTDHSQDMQDTPRKTSGGLFFTAEDDILYASKARQELLDLGVANSQLAQLAETGVYFTYVELRSPVDGLVLSRNVSTRQRIDRGTECFRVADLSRVWIEADIYDLEAQYIRPGTQALISLPRMAERHSATVSEVLPRYDAAGRSLKVRLEMDNPDIMFRPEMFVDVEFLLDLPKSITVPSGAVIDSGKRKIVYVKTGEGLFEPRRVVSGWRFNDRVEIVGGLRPGEQIVVSGNFLIDSESRMKLAATRLMADPVEGLPDNQASETSEPVPPQTVSHGKIKPGNENKVRDPVCGMEIDPNKAKKAGLILAVQGQTYYFCSEECAVEFHRHGPQLDQAAGPDSMPDSMPDASPDHEAHQMGHQP